ncbi:MAG: YbhB/YbcL family Raf kinase inhibitor-like protein [Burkholderiales bacterium]
MRIILTTLLLSLVATAQAAGGFKLSSSDIKPNGTISNKQVYKGFGCEGENISPALSWSGAPSGTKSFALLVHDPDAPTGGAGWWHWAVYNIPASANAIAQGAGSADGTNLPKGSVQQKTDFGAAGWGGPCPPQGHGKHHYHFTLHALKTDKLDIPDGATASLVGFMVNANSIGKAKLTGIYGRK